MPLFPRRTQHLQTGQDHTSVDHIPVGQAGSRIRRILSHRTAELGGLLLLVLALGISLSLFSFNPNDPSFNTATGSTPTNLLGRAGATVSEALIQWFGLGSALPVIILLAWTWQLVRHHSMSAPFLRLVAALLFLPAGAFLVGTAQLLLPGLDITWPSDSGLGGAVGVSIARYTLNAMHGMMGAAGGLTTCLAAMVLVLLLAPIAMGLSGHEWQVIGRSLWMVLRWPLHLLRHSWHKEESLPPTAEEPRLFNPQPYAGPTRPGMASMVTETARPSGFLRHRFSRPDPHLSPSPEPSSLSPWMNPPQTSTPAPEPATSTSVPTPEAEETPSNPYRERLARIYRADAETSPAAPSASFDMDYDDDEDVLTEQIPPQKKPGVLERLMARGTPDTATPHRQTILPPSTGSHAPQADFTGWQSPPLSLLEPAPDYHHGGPPDAVLQSHAQLLEAVLNDYGVQGKIRGYHAGPVVTLYELEPAPGVRSSRVIGLSDDIARSLSVLSVRIATIPGRNVIGIEVPNAEREMVYFSELLHAEEWQHSKARLQLALGKDLAGNPVFADLAKMPHLLVAGTTGSGKSVGINAMILSLLYRLSPEDCRLIMIDPKILELSIYDGIPHLMTPVVTEPSKAVSALKWAVQEMDRRYRLMADHQVRNISGYNERIRRLRAAGETPTRRVQTGFDPETGRPVFDEHRLPLEHLPYIVVVIDEMADLMMVAGKEIEATVLRLAQKARAAGIHVIMATQRPSVDVITGTIKANFPTRISFQVTNKYDSRTILGEQGAEQLLGRGDMLFMQGGARITRVHGPFISDEEVEAVVNDLRAKGQPVYNADIVADDPVEDTSGRAATQSGDSDGSNDLYDQAVDLVLREGRASTSFVQRHLSIGYNRAANIIDQMEREGIISAANHVGKREILASRTMRDVAYDTSDDSNDL